MQNRHNGAPLGWVSAADFVFPVTGFSAPQSIQGMRKHWAVWHPCDNLAWESSPAQVDGGAGRTVHYIFEPGTFIPVAQALRHKPIHLLSQPDYSGDYTTVGPCAECATV